MLINFFLCSVGENVLLDSFPNDRQLKKTTRNVNTNTSVSLSKIFIIRTRDHFTPSCAIIRLRSSSIAS